MSLLPWRRSARADDRTCGCRATVESPTGTGVGDRRYLRVDADDCAHGGDLSSSPPCRRQVIATLDDRAVASVRVVADGRRRAYLDDAAAALVAAGRFASLVEHHDAALAARARVDPLAAAQEATGRTGAVGRLVASTGLDACVADAGGYADLLDAHVGPAVADAVVLDGERGRVEASRELDTGATVKRVADGSGPDRYRLRPLASTFDRSEYGTLAEAAGLVAGDPVVDGTGEQPHDPLDPAAAVRAVAPEDARIGALTSVLRKHTRGPGVLRDLFADDRVSDVFVTAPAATTPIRVVVDGDRLSTNVRLTADGAAALASRLRAVSGRAFSRTTPRIDASLRVGDDEVRVAGVTRPLSDGPGFALRRQGSEAWTLPRLVDCGSLTPRLAGLLRIAVRRGAAGLVAGARGVGKTTTLGALLWTLPAATRTVVLEDTPELPVEHLQTAGRDVQRLRVARGDDDTDETAPQEALRTALRLGEGAIVVGEIRGSEAATLYEAMRVGDADGAVLGTVHGDGAAGVRTRMVEDLGVSEAAFGATGFVLTMADTPTGRRAVALDEVRTVRAGETSVVPLFAVGDDGALASTGVLDCGDSELLATLTRPNETYGSLLDRVDRAATAVERLAAEGVTSPSTIRTARERAGD